MNTKLNRKREELLASKRTREKANDVEIQGEITGAIYRNGPISARGCTDTFFCGLYIIFLIFLLAITIVGFLDGDVRYLYTGYDSDCKYFYLFSVCDFGVRWSVWSGV